MTVILDVVAPVLQTYVPPLMLRTADVPIHMIPSLLDKPEVSTTLITGTGVDSIFTVRMIGLIGSTQPLISVTVTVY